MPPQYRSQLYTEHPLWWGRVECCRILSLHTSPVLAYYSNVLIGDCPDFGVIWPLAGLEVLKLELMRFIAAAEIDAVVYEFHEQQMGHGSCGALVSLLRGVHRRIDPYGFAPFVAKCDFHYESLTWPIDARRKSIG